MSELIELKVKRSEAEAAYHNLQLGKTAVLVKFGRNKETQFNAANAASLKAYIAELSDKISKLEGNGGRKYFTMSLN